METSILLPENNIHYIEQIAVYEVIRYEGANLVDGGRTIQGDVLIDKSGLNEVVRYLSFNQQTFIGGYRWQSYVDMLIP